MTYSPGLNPNGTAKPGNDQWGYPITPSSQPYSGGSGPGFTPGGGGASGCGGCLFLIVIAVCFLLWVGSGFNPPRNQNTSMPVSTMTVNTPGGNLREEPGKDEQIIAELAPNTEVTLLGETKKMNDGGTWVKVRAGTQEGWVNRRLLR